MELPPQVIKSIGQTVADRMVDRVSNEMNAAAVLHLNEEQKKYVRAAMVATFVSGVNTGYLMIKDGFDLGRLEDTDEFKAAFAASRATKGQQS